MPSSAISVLTPAEWAEGAVVRIPPRSTGLECLSIESDGTLVAWNGKGQPVEFAPADHPAVAALLMRGLINPRQPEAIQQALTSAVSDDNRDVLRELYFTLTAFLPPDAAPRLVAPSVPVTPDFAVQRATVALLWTVNPQMHLTSCIGPADRFLPLLPTGQLPSLFALCEYGESLHPLIVAHQTALNGMASRFTFEWQGLEWTVSVSPVHCEISQRVTGTITYLTTTETQVVKVSGLQEEGLSIWTADGRVQMLSASTRQLLQVTDEELQGLYHYHTAQLLHDIILPRVRQPKEFLKRFYHAHHSPRSVAMLLPLKDGRVLHRLSQPLIGGQGRNAGMAVFHADVTDTVVPLPEPEMHGNVA